MRLFIAINFDERTKGQMIEVQKRLKSLGNGRFSSPENLHLTLAFLGEIPEERVDGIKAAMDSVDVPAQTLVFESVGCFRRNSELWWIGLKKTPALMKLQQDLSDALTGAGFRLENRSFKPHITLAREMHIGQADSNVLLPRAFNTKINAMSLMLSHRPNGKLTYTELYRRQPQKTINPGSV